MLSRTKIAENLTRGIYSYILPPCSDGRFGPELHKRWVVERIRDRGSYPVFTDTGTAPTPPIII